jgi:proteasome accessory factor C
MESHKKFYRVFRLISLLSSPPAKSINSLASSIDVTERSLYRYIELLEALGFEIEKDASKHYFITSSEHDSKEVFTLEEADLIRQIIISQGNKSPLADGILKKLYINTEVNISVNHLINANLSGHINKISEAIATNTQAILKQYFSLNSETVSDRQLNQ